MKTYKVGIWEEMGAYVYIQAKSPKQAENLVNEGLEENGIEYFRENDIYTDVTHREINIIEKPELSK